MMNVIRNGYRACFALAPALLAFSLFTKGESAEPRRIASVEGITEYQLDNGLRALLFPDNSQSKVTVNLTVLVGSRQEGYGETGMAHLLEHMVFKGTPRHPKIPKALQEHGAQFNGSTSNDRVNYFETLTATEENLEFALDLEADRMVNSYIKQEDLDSEMTVVRNEFERGENSPGSVLSERISSVAYDWHNYGKSTIGNRTDIERVPVENLRAFYRKYYQPDNVVLIVAGKFDESKTLGLVQKYFGPIPRPERKLTPTYTEEPAQDGERSVTLRRVGDVSMVGIAWHMPAASHPDAAALEVLAAILRNAPSGRLYKALVETGKASGVSAFAGREHDPGLMMADAQVTRGGSPEEVRDAMISIVESVGAKGVTTEEVNRARQQILKQREMAANETAQIGVSLSEWAAQGDWRLYFLHRDHIEQVTREAVQAAAARYLQRNNRTVGIFIPTEKAERVAVPPTPDVAAMVVNYKGRQAIAEGEAFEATPENVEGRIQRSEMPEGIKVTLMQKKTRGAEAHLVLTLHYGNEENLKGLESAGGFLSELMLRGTKKLNHQQLRDELDKMSATLSAGAGGGGRRGGGRRGGPPASGGLGTVTFSIQAKRETLPAVIEILGQVLREPTLPVEEFDVLRSERLAMLQQMQTEPAMLAPRLLQRELNSYAKDDVRYVPTIEESIQRLKDVSYEQVTQLYRRYLGSQTGELTIVGDFDAKACLPILERTLQGWKAAQPYARIAMPLAATSNGGEHEIKTPDKANATYTAGLMFALQDDNPDYPALVMGNYIFGAGALSSRLGDRIRQKEGLSYGVSSSLSVSSQDKRAGLMITAICNPQNIGKVQKAALEEFERLLREGVTAEELEKAKQGYLQAQKVARANDGALAGMLSGLRYLGRTMAFEAEVESKIQALTPEQVNAALRKHLDAKKLVVVTAGDFQSPPAVQAKTSPE
jgi:zinc protease